MLEAMWTSPEWARRVAASLAALHWSGGALVVAGIGLLAPWVIALGTLLIAIGLLLSDVWRLPRGGVTSLTVYTAVSVASSFGNVIGLLSADTPARARYFLYTAEEHLLLAMLIAAAGVILPVWGFWMVSRRRWLAPGRGTWLRVRADVPDRLLVMVLVPVALAATAYVYVAPIATAIGTARTGTIGILFSFAPHFAAFTLARAGVERNVPHAIAAGGFVALVEAARAFLYDYARGNTATPLFAFVCGMLFGARSPRALIRPAAIPVFALGMLWAANYGLVGEIRGSGIGMAKVEALLEHHERTRDLDQAGRQTVLARLTNFNQISQIGRIVEEEGFLGGRTLSYLSFAFIPRFLWPEKPYVERGAWFAVRIGQGMATPDGWYNNAINMTHAGELYLNFDWIGMLIGLPLFGVFLGLMWESTGFWTQPRNVLGCAFAFYLMWGSLGGAGDFTLVVTVIAVYLIFLALTWITRAGVTAWDLWYERRGVGGGPLPAPAGLKPATSRIGGPAGAAPAIRAARATEARTLLS